MSNNLPRLAAVIRRDLARARPIIETSRLDHLIDKAHNWRRVGLPAASMGGGSGHGGTPADPTGTDATRIDAGNAYSDKLAEHLDGIQRHLRGLIQLDMQVPVEPTLTCDRCGRPLDVDARAGICGACRKRNQRRQTAA